MGNLVRTRSRGGYNDYTAMIEDIFNRPMRSFFGDSLFDLDQSNALRVAVTEEEDKYLLRAEVPGLPQDNISLNFEDGMVTLSAQWKEDGEGHLRSGTYHWSRRFNDIDIEKAQATLKDGVLKVELLKSEAAKPRRIEIK